MLISILVPLLFARQVAIKVCWCITCCTRFQADCSLLDALLAEPKPEAQVAVIEAELIPERPALAPEAKEETKQSSDQAANWQAVVGLSALLAMICSVDRAAMSVALGPMGDEFLWSDTVKGTISSSFFIGYTLTNFVGETACQPAVLECALCHVRCASITHLVCCVCCGNGGWLEQLVSSRI